MALPLIPFILKVVVIKIYKGAIVGFSRYLMRIFGKKQKNENGDELKGMDHVNQVVNEEWKKKDNLIFLALMLCSALYGLQELLVWVWIKIAKWRYPVFFAFTPAALESPDEFIMRIHTFSTLRITYEIIRWVLIASLFYWPKAKQNITITASDNPRWVNIFTRRQLLMLRIDEENELTYKNMHIKVDVLGNVSITEESGEITIFKNPTLKLR